MILRRNLVFEIWAGFLDVRTLDRFQCCPAVAPSGPCSFRRAREAFQEFLDTLSQCSIRSFSALGLGEDIRIDGSRVVGGGLVVDDRIVHLGVFLITEGAAANHEARTSRISRASLRRRSH